MSIFKKHIDAMSAYLPPLEGRDPSRFTLLDFNERTVPVAEPIVRDIADWVSAGRMQMYPSYGNVSEKIAGYCGVDAANVMMTNGSDQGIDLIFRASCGAGSEVIIPEPTFPIYGQSAAIEGARIHAPVYSLAQGYPLVEVLSLINPSTRVIVVANPNNPSGTSVSREDIVSLAEAAPRAVILIDECYFEYCGITISDLVESHPNIVVTRTFSKTWGLPSLRIGYLIAAKENIHALLKVRGPYDVNQVAVVAVESALRHQDSIRCYIDEVMLHAKPKLEAFLVERQVLFWPSVANFLWAFFDDAMKVEEALRGEGILVRPKADADGRLGLRMTIGTEEQNDHLISVLSEVLS